VEPEDRVRRGAAVVRRADALRLPATVVRGHGVAGGSSPDSPHPAGTIALQAPFFAARGLDLSDCHPATLNLSTGPASVHIRAPAHRFEDIHWTDVHGPETFEFVHVVLELEGREVEGWGYRPTAATKAAHPQPPEVLEVIAPYLPELETSDALVLRLDPDEVSVEHPTGR
jgi:hypothetical protein